MSILLALHISLQTRSPHSFLGLVQFVLYWVALWMVFVKAEEPGWAVLIPLYNVWVLYRIICGRGTAMLRLLIPFYNIYWLVKSMIALAHCFDKSTGFGICMVFFPHVCSLILGFGSARYCGPEDL